MLVPLCWPTTSKINSHLQTHWFCWIYCSDLLWFGLLLFTSDACLFWYMYIHLWLRRLLHLLAVLSGAFNNNLLMLCKRLLRWRVRVMNQPRKARSLLMSPHPIPLLLRKPQHQRPRQSCLEVNLMRHLAISQVCHFIFLCVWVLESTKILKHCCLNSNISIPINYGCPYFRDPR